LYRYGEAAVAEARVEAVAARAKAELAAAKAYLAEKKLLSEYIA
jgi:hypothetical protein